MYTYKPTKEEQAVARRFAQRVNATAYLTPNLSLTKNKEQLASSMSKLGNELVSNPLDKQVGGDHYKTLKIQPIEYIMANDLGFCEANIVKYITRHSQKGGVADIDKVIHYAELLKQLKYT